MSRHPGNLVCNLLGVDLICKPSDDLYTWTGEDIFCMGGITDFPAQVLSREMQITMHVASPVGAFADIVYDAVISNPFFTPTVSVVPEQLSSRYR